MKRPHLQKYGGKIPYPKNIVDLLCHKTQHWDYEQESRIIVKDHKFYSITGLIKKVILGIRCSDMHKRLIKSISPINVDVVHARLDHTNAKVIA